MMVSLRGHFNSLDELECIWDELKESQDKISTEGVSRKAEMKSVGTQKDDLIHWHSLIVEEDENGNEVLPELELIDAPQVECKEEADKELPVVGDKYIHRETREPATQEKPKKKTKKQKARVLRRKKRVFPEDCSNTSEMARQSRRRQQTEELPRQKESVEIPDEPNDQAQEINSLLNEEETYEDLDVVKKIKLKRYAKLPDE